MLDPVRIRQRLEETDQYAAVAQLLELRPGRLAHFYDGVDIECVADELRARLVVRGIGEGRCATRLPLDDDLETAAGKPRDDVRNERDAPFSRLHLARDPDPHRAAV